MTHTTGRRSRARARLITAAAIAIAIVVIAGGALVVTFIWRPGSGVLTAYLVAVIVLLTTLAVLARVTTRRARALRSLEARQPDSIVFLARRLPPVVSDLPAFLAAKGIEAEIGDRWYPGTASSRGITVWTDEANPREMVPIEWSEIGQVLAVRTPTVGGDRRWTVTVDVKPYVSPLTVEVGYAWGVVTMPMDAVDTADLVAAITALRP